MATKSRIKIWKCKYLNNIVEQDHRYIKPRIVQGLGFKEFEPARRILTGTEIVHMIRRNQINNRDQTIFKSFETLAASYTELLSILDLTKIDATDTKFQYFQVQNLKI